MRPAVKRDVSHMHPEIKKFWNQKYKIFCEDHDTHQDWFIIEEKYKLIRIAIFQNRRLIGDLEYMYENKWYSEEDMLRIINLAAFV